MNDIEILKGRLIRNALKDGICEEGYDIMQSRDIDGLVDYYIANPDWCLERDFPDLQTLATDFADIQNKGVYINTTLHGEVLNDLQVYIFHNCKGVIKTRLNLAHRIIPMFYFANNCDITIECMEDIVVPLYIFGENRVITSGNAKFKTYQHKLLNS